MAIGRPAAYVSAIHLLRAYVLRHFGAEPFGVGKVRDRAWMPDGVTDQLGQSAKRRFHNHVDSAARDGIAIKLLLLLLKSTYIQ